jgi:hypothetical protein
MLSIYLLSALVSLICVIGSCWGYNVSEQCTWSYFAYIYAFIFAGSLYLIISFFQILMPKIMKLFKKTILEIKKELKK